MQSAERISSIEDSADRERGKSGKITYQFADLEPGTGRKPDEPPDQSV